MRSSDSRVPVVGYGGLIVTGAGRSRRPGASTPGGAALTDLSRDAGGTLRGVDEQGRCFRHGPGAAP